MKINLLVVFSLFAIGCVGQSQIPASSSKNNAVSTRANTAQINSTADYQSKLKAIAAERLKIADQYQQTASQATRREIIEKAQEQFITSIDKDIFPFWYGTEWDFYGTTEKPGEGKIACGYFVTTVLRDAGMRINRVSLAQQASENIIKSLTTEPNIRRFSNATIENFVKEVRQSGAGLYVVGLDFHVGFILHDGAEVYFIHSSYVEPGKVVREKAVESAVLTGSKYRIIGKISGDNQFIVKWLDQSSIPTFRR